MPNETGWGGARAGSGRKPGTVPRNRRRYTLPEAEAVMLYELATRFHSSPEDYLAHLIRREHYAEISSQQPGSSPGAPSSEA